MPDYSHLYTQIHRDMQSNNDYDGKNKTWIHKPGKIYDMHTNESWKDYDPSIVSITDLAKWNKLDEPGVLTENEVWRGTPDTWRYNSDKDTIADGIIYGTKKPDGSIQLGTGRHRIKALQNGGYTHVIIPVRDERLMKMHPSIYGDLRSNDIGVLNDLRHNAQLLSDQYNDIFNLSRDDVAYIKNAIDKRKAYLNYFKAKRRL